MGQAASFGLTQFEVDELVAYTNGNFSQEEVEALYKRFRSLDKGHKGFITSEEFLSIPELSINPLSKRLAFFFESINFKEFVAMLAPYSAKAGREDKLRHMFMIYDVDGDGAISAEDMEHVLRQMVGASLAERELAGVVRATLAAAGAGPRGLTYPEYAAALGGTALQLRVQVPTED